jgi:hypothetical protein
MNSGRKQIIQEMIRQIHPDTNKKVPFPMKLFLALKYSDQHPNLINEIGIKWINDSIFCFNLKILAQAIGCSTNNIQKALQKHRFKKHSDIIRSFNLPPHQPRWKYSISPSKYFNRHSSPDDIDKMKIPKFFSNSEDTSSLFGFSPDEKSYIEIQFEKYPYLCDSLKIGVKIFLEWANKVLPKEKKKFCPISFSTILTLFNGSLMNNRSRKVLSYLITKDPFEDIEDQTNITLLQLSFIFLRFGKFSPFDYLANFIHQDSDLICSKGFFLFKYFISLRQIIQI